MPTLIEILRDQFNSNNKVEELRKTIKRLNTELTRVNEELKTVKDSNKSLSQTVQKNEDNLVKLKTDLENAIKKAEEDLATANNKAQSDLNNERTRATEDAKKKETEYMKTLYKEVYNQNQALLAQQTAMRDSFSTDDQKVYYQAIEIQYLAYYNYILMIIYYILAAICVIILFFRQETIKNIYVKGVLAILILTYLYTIPYVESLVYNLFMMISSLIYGDVYLMKY